jgi:Na+/glutamate symporter
MLGAVIGAFAGFFAGSLIADATSMSCFEGGCGYFALFTGLVGLVVGAIGGGIFAVWRVHRRKRKQAA